MRITSKLIVVVGSAMLVGGCAHPQTSGQLNDRLSNAAQITDARTHDSTFDSIAIDAANSGQSAPCLTAVDGIKDRVQRDLTAHKAADIFNGKGDRTTAEQLVAKISDPNLRDQVLQAYGRYPAPQAH